MKRSIRYCVTKKDLRNIGTSFNLFNSERLHSNDATSVDLWVKGINEMEDNLPVLIYKPQGERFANLEDKDFCLVIMTVAQKELLKFGHEKICIDSIHGTNP